MDVRSLKCNLKANYKFSLIIALFTAIFAGNVNRVFGGAKVPRFQCKPQQAKIKNGGLFLVQVDSPVGFSASSIEAFGKNFSIFKSNDGSYQGFVAVPYEAKKGKKDVVCIFESESNLEPKQVSSVIHVIEGAYAKEKLKVDPKFTKVKKEDADRIAKDIKAVGEVYRNSDDAKHWNHFSMPVQDSFTGFFGTRRMFNQEFKSFHQGLDIRAAPNTIIRSPSDGRVAYVGDLFFTGNTVILDHGLGLFTIYAHLNESKVKVGDYVKFQEVLALSGSTGRASGPHLHWGAVLRGIKFDPVDLIRLSKK